MEQKPGLAADPDVARRRPDSRERMMGPKFHLPVSSVEVEDESLRGHAPDIARCDHPYALQREWQAEIRFRKSRLAESSVPTHERSLGVRARICCGIGRRPRVDCTAFSRRRVWAG